MRLAVSLEVGRLAAVDQGEHPGDVAGIGGQDLGVLLVPEVGLVGQPDPGLRDVQQVAGGVLGIGVDVHAGAAADAGALQPAEHRGQGPRVGGPVDQGQLVEQRLHTAGLDGVLVEEAGVEITDALLVGALVGLRSRRPR